MIYLHHIIPQSTFGIVFDNFDFNISMDKQCNMLNICDDNNVNESYVEMLALIIHTSLVSYFISPNNYVKLIYYFIN